MSALAPKPEVEDDKVSLLSEELEAQQPTQNEAASTDNDTKASVKISQSTELLDVPQSEPIRPISPDAQSTLSTDDLDALRRGRRNTPLVMGSGRLASLSPAPPKQGLKGRWDKFWRRNKGVVLMLFAQFFGVLMTVTTRLLEIEGNEGNGIHPFQILFARMSITIIISSLYMWRMKTPYFPWGMKEVRWLLFARGFGGFFGVFGMYYSLLYLPLADATVITFLAPGLACWACSILIKEPFTRVDKLGGLISLIGVVLIARPTSLLSFSGSSEAPSTSGSADGSAPVDGTTLAHNSDASNYDNVTPSQRLMAVGIALIGVMGAATAFTTIRWIGKRAHPLISVNYFAAWSTLVSIVMMFVLPDVGFFIPSALKDWAYLIFLGLCGFIMQFLLAAGLSHERSSRATNMTYTQMLFALLFDKLIFGTTPGFMSVLGSSLILGSAIYVAMQKSAVSQKEATEGSLPLQDEEQGLIDNIDAEDGGGNENADVQEVQLRTLR
ncbi:MAG: hypothetical protein M1820_004305 [Bogoriella megaspora]|nr:MAG: hypothetical protein M1820_004305 [Bogoriella megaspora]